MCLTVQSRKLFSITLGEIHFYRDVAERHDQSAHFTFPPDPLPDERTL
jgi:hypothetical protein